MSGEFPDLVQLFDSLPTPSLEVGMGRFSAQWLDAFPSCAVGKDVAGNPTLLISADTENSSAALPLVLEHLSVMHLVNCRVQLSKVGEQTQILSVVRCTHADRILQEYFLRSLYPIVASLPQRPSSQQIRSAIDRLVDLFRQLSNSPRKTVAGLWAELFVIARATDPSKLLAAWHCIPEEHFDFLTLNERMEVKAACGPTRVHHFSLEQLRPPTGVRVIIASLLLDSAGGGKSINDLIDTIRRRLPNPESLVQLDCQVAQILGQDWRAMRDCRFDYHGAIQSFRLIRAEDIPSVPIPIPLEVLAVRFKVDLSRQEFQEPGQLCRNSELFVAAAPLIDE